jgi:hypothetical protein
MTPEQTARLRQDAISAGQAAAAAGAHAAILAVGAAAQNAAKTGGSTTEFKATLGGIVTVGVLAALQVLSVLPGPWMMPALALSAAITVGSYALSRGSVKSAALSAAGAAVAATEIAVAPKTLLVAASEGTRVATTP